MCDRAAVVLKPDSADNQRTAATLGVHRLKPMQVIPVADPKLA
jgi:hypothetical protein